METRESLNKGIEQMMAGAIRRSSGTGLEAEKICPKCGSRWWEQKKAMVRDLNRGGQASKFNTTVFEYFLCVGCGHQELPDTAVQVSRDMRLYYADFVKTLNGMGKHKAMTAEDVFPGSRDHEKSDSALEEVQKEIAKKKGK